MAIVIWELRHFDTQGGHNTKGAFQYRNITFGRVDWFVRECIDADPENSLLLPSRVDDLVDVVYKISAPPVEIPEAVID